MNELWNDTCVLISNDGNVFVPDARLGGHNLAINDCGKKVGLDIDTMQSMVSMLEKVVCHNHMVLLNGGMREDENGISKRTGYLALPSNFTKEQIPQIEILQTLLNEYAGLTVWKMKDNHLRTKSYGDISLTNSIIQEMLNELTNEVSEDKKI